MIRPLAIQPWLRGCPACSGACAEAFTTLRTSSSCSAWQRPACRPGGVHLLPANGPRAGEELGRSLQHVVSTVCWSAVAPNASNIHFDRHEQLSLAPLHAAGAAMVQVNSCPEALSKGP
jgi:hypothetical protein